MRNLIYETDRYGDKVLRDWANAISTVVYVLLWVSAIGGVTCGIVYGVATLARSANRAECHGWAAKTSLPTTFRINHFLAGGQCFVTLPNGKVAPTDHVQYRVSGG